jgi:hypothetical protein
MLASLQGKPEKYAARVWSKSVRAVGCVRSSPMQESKAKEKIERIHAIFLPFMFNSFDLAARVAGLKS